TKGSAGWGRQVGTVVTDQLLENVLAIGYNGNARGLPNKCDSSVPGSCGCIHSEMNALVKAPGSLRDKVVFISASPCVMCAKLMINSGVTHVFYRTAYRDPSGIEELAQGGVTSVLYDHWVREWRCRPPAARIDTVHLGSSPIPALAARL